MVKYYDNMGIECDKESSCYVLSSDYIKEKQNHISAQSCLASYQSMHKRACSDVKEYSKALEIICDHHRNVVARYYPNRGALPQNVLIEAYLEQARKELDNGK